MLELRVYPAEDRDKVDEALFTGEKEILRENLEGTPGPVQGEVDMQPIANEINDIISGNRASVERPEVDAHLAPIIHRNMDLTRAEASKSGIWHWMSIILFPEFVRYRWPWDEPNRTYKSMREKFLGTSTDIYSNAFGRLWWMAELSYDVSSEEPYRLTKSALERQYLANRLFDPAFGRYRPAVVAFTEALSVESSETIRHANRRFNQALTSIQLESQKVEDLREIVDDVVDGVKEDFDV